ncbi:MAG: hypothetical protein HQ518_28370 [Rhodopirellula sp.]|nr:hypothetical protein [Rhodopirellula sp.]
MPSLYNEPAYAGVVNELKAELARLQKVYAVPDDTGSISMNPASLKTCVSNLALKKPQRDCEAKKHRRNPTRTRIDSATIPGANSFRDKFSANGQCCPSVLLRRAVMPVRPANSIRAPALRRVVSGLQKDASESTSLL